MLSTNIPSHQHGVSVQVSTAAADSDEANGNFLATAGANIYANAPAAGEHYGTPSNTSNTGAQLPFNNMQPWLGLIICIAMQGVYPSRN
jgi:microcystin-dependent protein